MSERINIKNRLLVFRDLKMLEYKKALEIQINTRAEKIADPGLPDQLFFVEHPPIFTFGKNGGRENLVVPDEFLSSRGVATAQTDRGGNVTYHGPGQAVLYPIIDLERAKIGVADFVHGLEEIMMQVALSFDIKPVRDSRNHGLWVGSSKIGSVGLSIKKGISIHGFAMNINPDLTPFSWINPCGMENVSITSVAQELKDGFNESLSMDRVKYQFVSVFCDVFNYEIKKERFHV